MEESCHEGGHIEWKGHVMKVDTATHTVNTSVADAIRYCRETLKLPEFQGSEGTCEYTEILDRLWCLIVACIRNYKAPLMHSREGLFLPFLDTAYKYLSTIKNENGQAVINT